MKSVVITIPAFNEESSLAMLVKDIHEVMKSSRYSYKILVLDDGSTDRTKEVAYKLGAVVFSNPVRMGLAETFKTEMKKALELNPDIIIHIDADYQYSPKDIPRLIKPIEDGEADLVLGNRFQGGIDSMPLMKRLGNKAFSKVISDITRFRVGDCQTGFRAMNKKAASLPIISNHTYTQEQIIRAVRSGLKIKEIPTHFYSRKSGKSKLLKGPFEYAIKAWINILRLYRDFEPLKFFGRIGLFFILVGLIVGAYVLIDFFIRKNVGHLPLTVLTVLLIVMGIQILLFGFLADMKK
ncbi:MAG: glycosyltransferase family 2 protein [Nanoarchaeota archaeon]